MQHRCIAPAVEQQHALLAAFHPLLDGGDQLGGKHGATRLFVHVHTPHFGQKSRANARGHQQALVTTAWIFGIGRAAVMPAFQRGRGRGQQHRGVLQAAPVHRQVSRRIAGALLLFVAGVVFFVDHDQFQVRHGRKNGHARTQHDAGVTCMGGQPALQALGGRHAAVHGHHGFAAKARSHPLLELGREVDLRHHEQRLGLWVGGQHALDGLQINLGFAAAGAAKQQEGPGAAGHLRQHGVLLF